MKRLVHAMPEIFNDRLVSNVKIEEGALDEHRAKLEKYAPLYFGTKFAAKITEAADNTLWLSGDINRTTYKGCAGLKRLSIHRTPSPDDVLVKWAVYDPRKFQSADFVQIYCHELYHITNKQMFIGPDGRVVKKTGFGITYSTGLESSLGLEEGIARDFDLFVREQIEPGFEWSVKPGFGQHMALATVREIRKNRPDVHSQLLSAAFSKSIEDYASEYDKLLSLDPGFLKFEAAFDMRFLEMGRALHEKEMNERNETQGVDK